MVKQRLQTLINDYEAGIIIRDVQLLAVDPPADVIDAFNEVQRARQDRDRLKNEAEAYRNDVVPRARGEAPVSLLKPKPMPLKLSAVQRVMLLVSNRSMMPI